MGGRRLRKAEQALVNAAAEKAMQRHRPALIGIRDQAIAELRTLPGDLQSPGVREFMNQLATEIWTDLELAVITGGDPDSGLDA